MSINILCDKWVEFSVIRPELLIKYYSIESYYKKSLFTFLFSRLKFLNKIYCVFRIKGIYVSGEKISIISRYYIYIIFHRVCI